MPIFFMKYNYLKKVLVMGILSATLLAGVIGWFCKKSKPKVEDFREIIAKINDPVLIEQKLIELLPQAQNLPDNSIYVQMLSQVALFQSLQQKFDQAHQTLDLAVSICRIDDYEGQVSIVFERGRVFQQAGNIEKAQFYFEESYQLCKKHNLKLSSNNKL